MCGADGDPRRGLVLSVVVAKVHQLHCRYPVEPGTSLDNLKEHSDLSHGLAAKRLGHGYTEKSAPRRLAVRVFQVHDVMYGPCFSWKGK